MTFKFIYFDLDDTLTDHHQSAKHTLIDLYADYVEPKLNGHSVGVEEFIAVYERINREKWNAYAAQELSKEEVKYGRFIDTAKELSLNDLPLREMAEAFLSISQRYWHWIEGAEQIFKNLAKQYSCGIITNGFSEVQEVKFDHFNIGDWADPLLVSEEVGYMKPHPELFHYASSLVGYSAEEILYVGDSLVSDVKGALNSGWKVAWFNPKAKELPQEYQSDDVRVFQHFDELPKLIESWD